MMHHTTTRNKKYLLYTYFEEKGMLQSSMQRVLTIILNQ